MPTTDPYAEERAALESWRAGASAREQAYHQDRLTRLNALNEASGTWASTHPDPGPSASQRHYYTTPPPGASAWTPENNAEFTQLRQWLEHASTMDVANNPDKLRRLSELSNHASEAPIQDEASYYRWLSGEYGAVRPDTQQVQDRAANLYAPQGREIDQAQVQTQHAIAQRGARSGVKSGYGVGQQQQAWEAAANQRATMREKSIEQAVGLEQQSIMGEAQVRGYQLPLVQQMYSAAQQRQMAAEQAARDRENAYLELMAGLGGTAIGGIAGGPAGAAVGSRVGSSLAGRGSSYGDFGNGSGGPSGYAYQIPYTG